MAVRLNTIDVDGLLAGAEAFGGDVPMADIRLVDSGHFALETHAPENGAAMRDFLSVHMT